MTKLAIANRKGGVGKTTTAVNLAAALAAAGRTVLLIDSDTQGHCSKMLGIEPEVGLAELLDGAADPEACALQARPNLWVLAGGEELAGITREISRKDFRSEAVLSEALQPYEDAYDFALLDTAPGYTPMSVNVLFYAREVICPISMEILAVDGFRAFMQQLATIQAYTEVALRYVLPTILDGRVRKSGEILAQLEEALPEQLCTPIRYSVKLSEAGGWGKTIFEYAPSSTGAKDYAELARRVTA